MLEDNPNNARSSIVVSSKYILQRDTPELHIGNIQICALGFFNLC